MFRLAGAGSAALLDSTTLASSVTETTARGGLVLALILTVLAFILLMGIVSVTRRALTLVARLLTATADLARLVVVVMVGLIVVNALLVVMVGISKQ